MDSISPKIYGLFGSSQRTGNDDRIKQNLDVIAIFLIYVIICCIVIISSIIGCQCLCLCCQNHEAEELDPAPGEDANFEKSQLVARSFTTIKSYLFVLPKELLFQRNRRRLIELRTMRNIDANCKPPLPPKSLLIATTEKWNNYEFVAILVFHVRDIPRVIISCMSEHSVVLCRFASAIILPQNASKFQIRTCVGKRCQNIIFQWRLLRDMKK